MQTAGMHNQVRLWASQGHLQQLLVRLQQEGFVVYLTADHGNVTATGIGNPREGVLVETRGKRARVYDRPEFRDEVEPSSQTRFAGLTMAYHRLGTFSWLATSRRSQMWGTRSLPTAASLWKKSWSRLWRSPGKAHEENRRHLTEAQTGMARRRTGSSRCRRRTRRNCVRFSISISGKSFLERSRGPRLPASSCVSGAALIQSMLPFETGPWRYCLEYRARSASGFIGA